jgi:BarA-like signal transduction histidine kinase
MFRKVENFWPRSAFISADKYKDRLLAGCLYKPWSSSFLLPPSYFLLIPHDKT